jgi:hypothetical protein
VVALQYFPAVQLVQEEVPARLYFPVGQAPEQEVVVVPMTDPNLPPATHRK